MITNNNFSVLPWYTSIEDQHHRKRYAYSHIYILPVPSSTLIPFQILMYDKPSTPIDNFRIIVRDLKGAPVGGNRIQSFINAGMFIYTSEFSNYSALVYTANNNLDFTLPYGHYYLEVASRDGVWYSDVFTVTDVSNCIKLEWWDNRDFIMEDGFICYANSFKNILYIDSEVGKPSYDYEEEGDVRDGIFFAEKQISEKTYRFNFIGPEYICDATRFVRLSDNVVIQQKNAIYNCSNVVIEVDWQEQGDLAVLHVEFKLGIVAKKIAPGFEDYSKDYNADYNIENE